MDFAEFQKNYQGEVGKENKKLKKELEKLKGENNKLNSENKELKKSCNALCERCYVLLGMSCRDMCYHCVVSYPCKHKPSFDDIAKYTEKMRRGMDK